MEQEGTYYEKLVFSEKKCEMKNPTLENKIALWDVINKYVAACGGKQEEITSSYYRSKKVSILPRAKCWLFLFDKIFVCSTLYTK